MRKRARKSMCILLEFAPPWGATFAEIREFITSELECAGGNRHPSDPLFESLDKVKVSKPIALWRDPMQKKKSVTKLFDAGKK